MGLRVYSVNGKRATFNKAGFSHLLKQKCRREKMSISKMEQTVAEKLAIAPNTVHKWNYNGGGPIDYATVEQLAEILDAADISLLLNFIDEGENEMARLTDRQMSAVKRIYDICIWFLFEFDRTNGFNHYWHQFVEQGSKDPESDITKLVDTMFDKVKLVVEQEYFDLRNCEIYDELCEFTSDNLLMIYDGKLSYAYRFEAHPNGNPTTSEDFDKAMIRLNTIIDKYL